MIFNSLQFIFIFLPLVLLVFSVLEKKHRPLAIGAVTFASFIFYAVDSIKAAMLLGITIASNYVIALGIRKVPREKARFFLTLGIVGNILFLSYYKYTNFLFETFRELSWPVHPIDIQLPPGLSFYIFVQIGFLVDVYRRVATTQGSLLNFSFFVSFFPHLIAGPIIHLADMMPQLTNTPPSLSLYRRLAVGLSVFTFGLTKKVMLADPLSQTVNAAYSLIGGGASINSSTAWVATICYTLQIYFDFSGYSDMAIGLAFLFGIHFPTNFNSPYCSSSIVDFWRRWHITLSSFLRDYIYIPLGGNRNGKLRRLLNIFITMFVAGIWHGAGWTFILWGIVHGIALVIAHYCKLLRSERPLPISWFWPPITFIFVHLAWVLFRSNTLTDAFKMYNAMFNWTGSASLPDIPREMWIGLLIVWFAPNVHQIMGSYAPHIEGPCLSTSWTWQPSIFSSVIIGILFTICIFSLQFPTDFIYFRF